MAEGSRGEHSAALQASKLENAVSDPDISNVATSLARTTARAIRAARPARESRAVEHKAAATKRARRSVAVQTQAQPQAIASDVIPNPYHD
jgi:hypothetical protein